MEAEREKKIRKDYENLTRLLISRQLSITTMESATAGQIASLITDTEGSSAIMKGAFVTYCNEAKIMQGVPAEVIRQHTVYSRETALAMARACKRTYDADIGIGVTGTFGNTDPANASASVPGHVYYAIIFKNIEKTYHIQLGCLSSRLDFKLEAAGKICADLTALLG